MGVGKRGKSHPGDADSHLGVYGRRVHIARRAPERLEELLSALVARVSSNDANRAGRAKLLRRTLAEIEAP